MNSEIHAALGLKANPFPSAFCKDIYIQTESTRRLLDVLVEGITTRRGSYLLLGESGLGKTSLLSQLFSQLETQDSVRTSWVFDTEIDKTELLRSIAHGFGLDVRQATHLAELLDVLHQFFLRANQEGHACAIIIDEAHALDFNCMEVLRMLTNLELGGKNLVQLVLAGQPDLKQRLEQPEFQQFRSRINNELELPSFSSEDTLHYVNARLAYAGSQLSLGGRALSLLWSASGGNARQINLIMEKALAAMVELHEKRVSFRAVSAALRELSGRNRALEIRLRSFKWRRYTLALALGMGGLLLAIVATLLVLSQRNAPSLEEVALEALPAPVEPANEPKASTPPKPEASPPVEKAPPAAAPPVETAPAPSPQPAPETQGEDTAFSQAAKSFLEPWLLGSLEPVLREAVTARNPAAFQEKVAAISPGLQLLPLEKLPAKADVTCSSFPWGVLAGGTPAYILLWKPPLRIATFTDGHQGPEITALQERLEKLRYYKGVDGKIGPGTRLGVLAFQKDKGLKQTGEPDAVTLFWLFAEHDASRNGFPASPAPAEARKPSPATPPTKSSQPPASPQPAKPPEPPAAPKAQFGL